ncbi:MAG: Ig-like domain-containing protein [Planktothrix sp. GU0601_MAG3]|nr:MAG: Ig-like domain-containing protein [Planktothrix sp. GU0601_MAG3]
MTGITTPTLPSKFQDDGGIANGGVNLDPVANTITIDVTPVNDAPSGADKTVSTNEDIDYTFTVNDFGFSDILDGDNFTQVKITTLPATGSLTLNGNAVTAGNLVTVSDITSGKLKFTPAPNDNGNNYANFTFQVQDDGGIANGGVNLDPVANTITIDVTPVNDAPSGADKTVSTNEDIDYTFTVNDFGFSDILDGDNFAQVKITTLPATGSLTLNGNAVTAESLVTVSDITSGKLKFTPALHDNGNNYANFTFQVQDDGGIANGGVNLDPVANTITIDVTPVNDAPSGADKTVSTNEDIDYTFTVNDFGFSDILDGNNFTQVKITTLPATGSLTLNGNAVTAGDFATLNDITTGKLKFTPALHDNGNNYANFTFQVQDDGGIANGGVNLDPVANTITIDVTPVNDAPSGADKTVSTNEDIDYTFTVNDFGFSDILDGNNFTQVKITTLPATGSLTLNGNAVTAGNLVTVSDITSGKLKFTPAPNDNGNNYANFTFQVQDDGGIANGGVNLDLSPNTITINVTPVNDDPSGADKTVSTNEDIDYTFTVNDFGFSDILDGDNFTQVKITTLPATGSLTLNGNAVTAESLVTVSDITSGKLKFTPAPNDNGNNYANFTFQVQDDGGIANGGVNLDPVANTITIDVTPVNDAPSGADKTVSTNEDIDYTFTVNDFGFSDILDGNNFTQVKITTLPATGSLTLNGNAVTAGNLVTVSDITSGKLKFTPALHDNGNNYANFTFQVQDDGGIANGGVNLDPVANTITIDVTPVNDAPSGADKTVSTNEDIDYTFTVNDFGFSDILDGDNFAQVKITTLPATGSLTLNGNAVTAESLVTVSDITSGKLKFTPALHDNGNNYANFTFQVQDDGGIANGGVNLDPVANTITIDVTPVNDAPSGADKTVSTNEDIDYTFTVNDFGFSDILDGNNFTQVKITTLPATGSLTLNGNAVTAGDFATLNDITTGKLKFTPALHDNGNNYANFTFQVQDDGGIANGGVNLDPVANTITIDVTPVNDAPSGADKTVSTNEDIDYTFTVNDFGFSDILDGNNFTQVKITTLPATGSLTLNGNAVTAGNLVTVSDITSGKLKFTPAPNDNGNNYANFTFQVSR